ncbi:contractile injection system tape measure protein [Paraburkholderia aspalathi]|uniref:contractile injection system tape measure protein n=1 Tax=Paraburkholderia aspalathi TaxID=1324617 RepID=UPI0038BD9B6B
MLQFARRRPGMPGPQPAGRNISRAPAAHAACAADADDFAEAVDAAVEATGTAGTRDTARFLFGTRDPDAGLIVLPPDTLGPWAVSNAGLVLLWPLLPNLLRTLTLTDADDRFVSDAARLDAVACLDWLAWGDERLPLWRTSLTRLLCGVPPEWPVDTRATRAHVAAARYHGVDYNRVDAWLSAVAGALPGLPRRGVDDIREQFLQRPGTLQPVSTRVELHVQADAGDTLLAGLPWPLTQVKLPWLPDTLPLQWRLS